MKINRVTKQQAARRQLDAAIEWFLEDRDYLPIYNIASCVFVITEDIARKNNIQGKTFYGIMSEGYDLRQLKDIKQEMGIKHGFLKHADRGNLSEINDVNEMQLAAILYFAARNYSSIFQEKSVQMELIEAFMYSVSWWFDDFLEIEFHEKYSEQINRYKLIAENEGTGRLKEIMLSQLYMVKRLSQKYS